MYTVALTGGMGAGKTSVSNGFAALGVPIIDTDLIARELVLPNMLALKKIIQHFGEQFVDANGHLDRAKLRYLISTNSVERKWLNQLLHPQIRHVVTERLTEARGPYTMIVIPLLTTPKDYPYLNRILTVECTFLQQVKRVMARDNITQDAAKALILAQPTEQERLTLADDIMSNNGSLVALTQQVNAYHKQYLDYAKRLD